MDEKASEWSIKTSIMYETVLASIDNFQPKLKMKGVTPEFLRKYEDKLASDKKAISTIGRRTNQFYQGKQKTNQKAQGGLPELYKASLFINLKVGFDGKFKLVDK